MKKLLLILLCFPLWFSSCTILAPVVYLDKTKNQPTHEQIMDLYKNKRHVINEFGLPQKKDSYDGAEIWHYDLGSISSSSVVISSKYGIGAGSSTTKNQFIEFTFNGDKVVNWRSKNVNYGSPKRGEWAVVAALGGFLLDFIFLAATGII